MRFKKPIVTTGVYTIPGDVPRKVKINQERLAHWKAQFDKMKEAGVSVPAPWNHSKEALPMSVGNDGTLPRSDINAGWWDKLWVEDGTLWGELDVPQSADAVKIGTNVKETSIYVRPDFEDGSGNKWQDSLMHIALVTHPIENGQGNFTPVGDESGLAISMSHLTEPLEMASPEKAEEQVSSNPVGVSPDRENSQNGVPALLEALRAVMIDLPEDTNDTNFMERLLVALRQKKASEHPEDKSVSKPPEGAKEQPAPVAMSQENAKEIEASSDDKQLEEVVMSHPKFQAAQKTVNFLMGHIGNQHKEQLASRRDSLIAEGKITEEYAAQHLNPSIDGFQMSFGEDGSVSECAAAQIMDALEAAPSLTTNILGGSNSSQDLNKLALAMSQSGVSGLPAGINLQEEKNPVAGEGLNPDDVALEFLKNTGHAS
tara:strand:- start:32327 stop:33613 length:1287 start_codon:yes stop_codon:yes gene_type:complete